MQLRKMNPNSTQIVGSKGQWEAETRTAELGDQVVSRNNAFEPNGAAAKMAVALGQIRQRLEQTKAEIPEYTYYAVNLADEALSLYEKAKEGN